MLWKLLEDTKAGDKPSHLAVIFDAGSKTFRNDMYTEYKANRSEPPDDLIPQFPLTRDAVRAFGVSCVEKPGFEADDLIATYARLAREAGARVTIVSSDKDLMQLIYDGKVEMLDPVKNRRIGPAEVIEKFGVPPEKVIDVQALIGDSIDNVPGVPGIGVKTAAELIGVYGDLENLLAHAAEIKQPKRREALIEHTEQARLSARLVQLDENVPLDEPIEDFAARDPDPRRADAVPEGDGVSQSPAPRGGEAGRGRSRQPFAGARRTGCCALRLRGARSGAIAPDEAGAVPAR